MFVGRRYKEGTCYLLAHFSCPSDFGLRHCREKVGRVKDSISG